MRLIGVGVGPGDPDLLTVRAVRVLRAAGRVVVPVLDAADEGRAERVVRAHLTDPARVLRVVFALNDTGGVTPQREAAWDAAADAVCAALDDHPSVAFATLGDPSVYSTFSYLAATVRQRRPAVVVERVPGITAMQDLAARSGTVLTEGTESLVLLPLTAGTDRLRAAAAAHDTVVAYKGGRQLAEVRAVLAAAGRADTAVLGSALGTPAEWIGPLAAFDGPAPYLSTVLSPPPRGSRGSRL